MSQASDTADGKGADGVPLSAARQKPKSVGGILSGLRAARKWGRVKRAQEGASEAPLPPLEPPQLVAAEQARDPHHAPHGSPHIHVPQ